MVAPVDCGGKIRYSEASDLCTSGCLVRFHDQPDIIMMLSVAHGLVRREANQQDIVMTRTGRRLGRLRTWTTFYQAVTADIALVWIDPAAITAKVAKIGALKGEPVGKVSPQQTLRFLSGGGVQEGTVRNVSGDLTLNVEGIDWNLRDIDYCEQIICDPKCSQDGDSGAIVVDADNGVVGMIVGARDYVSNNGDPYSATLITPIGAILNHPDFGRGRLELVTDIPRTARSPF